MSCLSLWPRSLPSLALLTLLVLVQACTGCLENGEEPIGVINRARIDSAQVEQYDSLVLRESAVSQRPVEDQPPSSVAAIDTLDKIHPIVRAWLGLAGAATDRWPKPTDADTMLIITFRDTLSLPPLPPLRRGVSRDSVQKDLLDQRRAIFDNLRVLRDSQYVSLTRELGLSPNDVVDSFDLALALVVRIPLDSARVFELAGRDDVIAIEPRVYRGVNLPASATPASSGFPVKKGRLCIASDPYFNLGLSSGYIGLLDNGVTASASVLQGQLGWVRDCVTNTDDECNASPGQPSDPSNRLHGTLSAAILTANNTLGDGTDNTYRGVTDITLDSYRIYNNVGHPDPKAAERALLLAVRDAFDSVVLIELQLPPGGTYTIVDTMADFIAQQVIVIVTNGNNGQLGVDSPARAHKVIGVGAYEIDDNQCTGPCDCPTFPNQSVGPTQDNRIKPDVLAPTNTSVMLGLGPNEPRMFPETSGAAPYVAGAAALLHNWILLNRPSVEPGEVYALLILSGQNAHPQINSVQGAGGMRLPLQGWLFWGKQTLHEGDTIDIPLDFGTAAPRAVNAAIWWPEEQVQLHHHNMDLYLLDPSDGERASSQLPFSVFERARAAGPSLPSGTWTLSIRSATNWALSSRTVYWAAHVLPR